MISTAVGNEDITDVTSAMFFSRDHLKRPHLHYHRITYIEYQIVSISDIYFL